ncbi:MAG: ParB/RepB/Spo0J family partition protein [Armatimonadota bacterium]
MHLIDMDRIVANPNQPRRSFYENSLEELAQSIRERGVLEPIVVRPKDGKYEIVMGERRFRASKIAGLNAIPAVVRDLSDEDAAADSLLENFQREDLNPVDRAKAIQALLTFLTWEKCASTLGVSESTLRRHMELLDLPSMVQQALVQSWQKGSGDNFTEAHARVLKVMNNDSVIQRRLIEKIKQEGLSVSDTQKLIDAIIEVPSKADAFLRVPLRVTDEIIKHMHKGQKKQKPFKAQTSDQHLAALNRVLSQLSDLIDDRMIDYLKLNQMNQLLSTCTTVNDDMTKLCDRLRYSLKKGDDGFREVYIHCPLCGRIELIGSMKCAVCGSLLKRCLDCGNYDSTYQKCVITGDYIYFSEADSPSEDSKSYKCATFKPKFEPRLTR